MYDRPLTNGSRLLRFAAVFKGGEHANNPHTEGDFEDIRQGEFAAAAGGTARKTDQREGK